jgi:hypothetical protein
MRLLSRKDDGTYCLTEFTGEYIPPYALLSRTWLSPDEEVTFKDITEGSGYRKPGYRKLRFCGEQASRDGLQYFWVDTCCIDKSSSSELTEALNSMFRWYKDGTRCYAFLQDISIYDFDKNGPIYHSQFETALRKCKWFTRGWTLQELIAPKTVEFFSMEGERIGDKKSLEQQIHEITGVAIEAFQGTTPLSTFNVDEIISWAEKRQTTRKEDKAYSLLGIFGVYMSPIYGEGEENGFIRLRREIGKFLVTQSTL